MNDFEDLAASLQIALALVDQSHRSGTAGIGGMEYGIFKLDNLKLKIYHERGHALPHIHIDHGKVSHVASFGIDPPKRLEGQLHKKYDRTIIEWLQINRDRLLEIWDTMQSGGDPRDLVAVLKSNYN